MPNTVYIARVTGVQVPSATTKIIGLLLAGSTKRSRLLRAVAGCSTAASGNAMVRGELIRLSDSGTPGNDGGAWTIGKLDSSSAQTIATTGVKARTDSAQWTAVPTTDATSGVQAIFGSADFAPLNGYYFDAGSEAVYFGRSGRIGFQLTTQGQAQTVDLELWFSEEE